MNNTKILAKMNEIYFTKLKQNVAEKLEMQYEPTGMKIKDLDVKSEIASCVNIYSIMADLILQETEKPEDLKEKMKKDIVSATKGITEMFETYVDNRIQSNGVNSIQEYKQALFNEIQNAIIAMKEENSMAKESEI